MCSIRAEDPEKRPDPFLTLRDVIFSRDMPGQQTEVAQDNFGAPLYRWVYRMNMRDFVRIKLNKQSFVNADGATEGSRASAKHSWHSRIDLTDVNGDGIWERNATPPLNGNSIFWGYLELGIAP